MPLGAGQMRRYQQKGARRGVVGGGKSQVPGNSRGEARLGEKLRSRTVRSQAVLGAEWVEVGSTLRRHWVLVGSGLAAANSQVREPRAFLPFPGLLNKRRGLLPVLPRPAREGRGLCPRPHRGKEAGAGSELGVSDKSPMS